MKKLVYTFLFIVCLYEPAFAQFYDNTSIYGCRSCTVSKIPNGDSVDHFVMTFPDGAVNLVAKKKLDIDLIWHTNSSFSDKNGNFMFFSNGKNIWDKNFKPLGVKEPLIKYFFDNFWDQFNLSLPFPQKEDTALLIYGSDDLLTYPGTKIDSTTGIIIDSAVLISKNLYYAEIKKDPTTGTATFVSKNNVIVEDTIGLGKFTACRHANGRDWWIVIPRFSISNVYYTLLLDQKGLHYVKNQKVGVPIEDGVGQACFSPNGKLYVRYDALYFEKSGIIDIFDFDRCSGSLSNQRRIEISPSGFGAIALSPNLRFLYYAQFDKVYQYDLEAPNIEASKVLVAEYDGFKNMYGFRTNFYRMQLMPDGRIYGTSFGTSTEYFHIIQKPNLKGVACRFEQHILKLPVRNLGSMPNFPNYRLGPLDGSPCDTLGIDNVPRAWYRYEKDTTNKLKVEFIDLSFYEPKKWEWDFGDSSPKSYLQEPMHVFPKKGSYNVCLTVSNSNGKHTHCKTINFGTTATQDTENQSIIQVTPNPFKDKIYVALSEVMAQPVFHLYDVTGKNVANQLLYYGITDIATENLSAGLYFWSITSKGEIVAKGKEQK